MYVWFKDGKIIYGTLLALIMLCSVSVSYGNYLTRQMHMYMYLFGMRVNNYILCDAEDRFNDTTGVDPGIFVRRGCTSEE